LTLAAVHSVTADDPVLLAMPSDHFIAQREAFRRAMERGAALAAKGSIVAYLRRRLRPGMGTSAPKPITSKLS
jgi:mannose-1-phosphate guanylyltransferase